MKKFIICVFSLFILLTVLPADDAYSQLNRRKIKKNNRRISNFRGNRSRFGKDKTYNYLGFSVNSFNYFGDIAPASGAGSTDFSSTRPGFGIYFGHRFGPRYTLRAMFNYGVLRGDDFESADPNDSEARFRYVRNLHFRNRIKEFSVVAMFDLFKNDASYISRVQWTPYIFLGATVFHHNPQAIGPSGEWIDLEPLGTEGQYSTLPQTSANFRNDPYNKIQFAIPGGIGIRYRLNQVLDLSFETSIRYLFTDYIDDVSKNYVDPDVLLSDLARTMADRSQEETAAVSGENRGVSAPYVSDGVAEIVGNKIVVNGRTVIRGYGFESPTNIRGNRNDNDIYVVTSIRLSFVLGASFRRAKFR